MTSSPLYVTLLILLVVAGSEAGATSRCCCVWNPLRECLPGFPIDSCAASGFRCFATPAPPTAAPITAAPTPPPTAAPLTCEKRLSLVGWRDNNADYLPVPQRSLPDNEGFRQDLMIFNRVLAGGKTHFLSNGGYNAALEQSATHVAVIDCPTLMADATLAILREIGKPVSHIVYSHAHLDHIGGCGRILAAYPAANVVASQETYDFLLAHTSDRADRPLPTIRVSHAQELFINENGISLELRQGTGAHSSGDISVYIPSSQSLVYIDVVFPRWVPFRSWAISESLPDNLKFGDYALRFPRPWTTFISGHLGRTASREDVLEWAEYMQDVINFERDALFAQFARQNEIFGSILGSSGNWWVAIFKLFEPSYHACSERLAQKWGGRLAGVDVYAYTHCVKARDFLIIDSNNFSFVVPTGPGGAKKRVPVSDLLEPGKSAVLHQFWQLLKVEHRK